MKQRALSHMDCPAPGCCENFAVLGPTVPPHAPHRDGQTDPVAAYFLICEGGSDPVIADVLGIKKRQLEGIVDQKADAVGVQIDPGRIKRLAEAFLDRHQQRVEREAVKALEEAGQSVMNFEPAPKPPAV